MRITIKFWGFMVEGILSFSSRKMLGILVNVIYLTITIFIINIKATLCWRNLPEGSRKNPTQFE